MFTNLLVLTLLSCVTASEIQDSEVLVPEPVDEAAESLDRMTELSETILKNYEKMNHNSEMIFRAVTGCSTDQECDAERARLEELTPAGTE
jgi:hypothetical protein|tara:strand:- start:1517 stop:1789 length:273 start_codon:yes stop_codon:yes gene_type:complete